MRHLFSSSSGGRLRVVGRGRRPLGRRAPRLVVGDFEPQLTRFRRIWKELAERGEAKDVPPEVMYFLITSGGGAMFASRALTERLFTGSPLEPQHYAAYAEQFTDLLMGALEH
jgi:hypothetical protein